jgi:hypothetical protein
MYWVLKIAIYKRMSIKKSISAKLLVNAVVIMKLGIISNAVMAFVFFNAIFEGFRTVSLVTLIVAVIFFVLPTNQYLIKLFVKKVDRNGNNEYENHKKNFTHYDITNPVTKPLGIGRLEGNSLKDQIRR